MSMPYEMEQMKRRLERLERELGETKVALEVLERRSVIEDVVSERPTAERAVPPPLPPPLPSAVLSSLPPPIPLQTAPQFRTAVPESYPVRDWLRRLQLLPPAAEAGGAEARLGAWWATRIGMLLAVVGVVFLGVYVSLNTPPWVKFLELVAVAVGVAGLGIWLTRFMAAFGSVVFAGGLSLLFFAAYAGHALPGVRVFESLASGVIAQAIAVALIVAASLWRRSAGLATLAIGLGYVTAFVSARGGLDSYALGSALALGVVAVALRRRCGWEGPSVVAMPAAYAIYALGLDAARQAGVLQLPAVHWLALGALVTLFFGRDWRSVMTDTAKVSPGEKIFQNANSSLALLCGAVTALGWARGNLEVFYFGAAVWCGVAAWLRSRQVRGGDVVAAVLLAKMTGALTLGVIEVAGARSAALALLVQAWVLAWSARRITSRVLAFGSAIVAVVALGYFWAYGIRSVPLWSLQAMGTVLFTLGFVALAVEGGRWLVADDKARRTISLLGAGVGAWTFAAATAAWSPEGWAPALWMGGAGLFGALAWTRRSGAAAWAAAGLAVLANLGLWQKVGVETAPIFVVGTALIVICPTVLAGFYPALRRWSEVMWGVAVVGVVLVVFELLPADQALAVGAVLAGGLVVLAATAAERRLLWLATLAAVLSAGLWMPLRGGMTAEAWFGFILLWALPIALRNVPALDAARRREPGPDLVEGTQVLVATLLGLGVVETAFSGAAALFALTGLVAATGLAAWLGRVDKAGWALGALGGILALVAMVGALNRGAAVVSSEFWSVLVAGIVLAALPLRPGNSDGNWPREVARVLSALAAGAVLFALFGAQLGVLEPYVTVGWGGVAILLFMAGLFRRAVTYRIIGLLALFPCVMRVFLVDLHSTLHRIAAFIALGLVFLWVGFSYHRFRHLLAPTTTEQKPDSSSS